jgi:hypothetical protein
MSVKLRLHFSLRHGRLVVLLSEDLNGILTTRRHGIVHTRRRRLGAVRQADECDLQQVKIRPNLDPVKKQLQIGLRWFANTLTEGGQFEGPKLRGTILPGGGDWEIVDPQTSTAYLDTRYNLKTHDGAVLYLQTKGVRKGDKAVLDRLGEDTEVRADEYK